MVSLCDLHLTPASSQSRVSCVSLSARELTDDDKSRTNRQFHTTSCIEKLIYVYSYQILTFVHLVYFRGNRMRVVEKNVIVSTALCSFSLCSGYYVGYAVLHVKIASS